MAGDQFARFVDENRYGKPEYADIASDTNDLLFRMMLRIAGIGSQRADRHHFDFSVRKESLDALHVGGRKCYQRPPDRPLDSNCLGILKICDHRASPIRAAVVAVDHGSRLIPTEPWIHPPWWYQQAYDVSRVAASNAARPTKAGAARTRLLNGRILRNPSPDPATKCPGHRSIGLLIGPELFRTKGRESVGIVTSGPITANAKPRFNAVSEGASNPCRVMRLFDPFSLRLIRCEAVQQSRSGAALNFRKPSIFLLVR